MSENPIDWSRQDRSQDGHGATKLLATPLTFQVTRVSQIVVFSLLVCATPLALSSIWLLPTYLLPILLSVWIVRNRTVIGDEQIVARTMFAKTTFHWDELSSLRLDERRWVRAILTSGREVSLPAVRVRDIPVLAQVSGGRLTDPTVVESAEESAADHDTSADEQKPVTGQTDDDATATGTANSETAAPVETQSADSAQSTNAAVDTAEDESAGKQTSERG